LGDEVCPVKRLVGLLDLRELVLLAFGEPVGVLSQYEAGALELFGCLLVAGAARLVSDLAADLVQRVGREVGSARGAVAAFRLLRFRGPPSEPVMSNST